MLRYIDLHIIVVNIIGFIKISSKIGGLFAKSYIYQATSIFQQLQQQKCSLTLELSLMYTDFEQSQNLDGFSLCPKRFLVKHV